MLGVGWPKPRVTRGFHPGVSNPPNFPGLGTQPRKSLGLGFNLRVNFLIRKFKVFCYNHYTVFTKASSVTSIILKLSSSLLLSSSSTNKPQSLKYNRYRVLLPPSLFLRFVIISPPFENTRSEAADVASTLR